MKRRSDTQGVEGGGDNRADASAHGSSNDPQETVTLNHVNQQQGFLPAGVARRQSFLEPPVDTAPQTNLFLAMAQAPPMPRFRNPPYHSGQPPVQNAATVKTIQDGGLQQQQVLQSQQRTQHLNHDESHNIDSKPPAESMHQIGSSLRSSTTSLVNFQMLQDEDPVVNQLMREGATIVPCRARGVPNHNAKNAYLVLRKDVQHGDDLLCSHLQCQNKGIRFVFCKVCDQPVAKYNFTTRHKHLDVLEPDETAKAGAYNKKRVASQKKAEELSEQNNDSSFRRGGVPESVSLTRRQKSRRAAASRNDADRSKPSSKMRKKKTTKVSDSNDSSLSLPSTAVQDGIDEKQPSVPTRKAGSESGSADSSSCTNDGSKSQNRRKRKRSIIRSRDLPSAMSLSIGSSSSRQEDSLGSIEKTWLELLKKRPVTNKRKKMKAWMHKVLFISEYVAVSRTGGSSSSGVESSSSSSGANEFAKDCESGRGGTVGDDPFAHLVGESVNVAMEVQREVATIGNSTLPPPSSVVEAPRNDSNKAGSSSSSSGSSSNLSPNN